MMSPRFPHRIHLSKPPMGGAELEQVQAAFASNWLSTVGPNLDALEAAFARRVGQPAVALSSGTAGQGAEAATRRGGLGNSTVLSSGATHESD